MPDIDEYDPVTGTFPGYDRNYEDDPGEDVPDAPVEP